MLSTAPFRRCCTVCSLRLPRFTRFASSPHTVLTATSQLHTHILHVHYYQPHCLCFLFFGGCFLLLCGGDDAVASACFTPSVLGRCVQPLRVRSCFAMSQIEEVLDRIRTAAGVEGCVGLCMAGCLCVWEESHTLSRCASYVIVNNAGEVLRKMPGLASDRASMIGAEVGRLAKKASSVVRDLDPKVSAARPTPRAAGRISFPFPLRPLAYQNTLSYLRLRAREKELLVAPGPDYLVVVIQRWKPAE